MKKWKAIIGAISGFTYKFGFEKLFLIIILPLGITYMVISPVLSGNDDRNHFMRAYEIANGKLVTANIRGDQVGGEWDKAFNELVVKEPSYSREKENISVVYIGENEFYNYPNTALYSPISYLPQTIGILIGKVFSASPYALVNFARIFNFIFYVIICYVAFKLLPRFKLFFLVLMTSPAILLSATSISADSFLCALIFLLAALIQYMNDKKIEFSWRHGSIFAGLAILISGCKVVYFPAILLLFLIDKNAFKSRKSKILWCVGLVSIGVAVGVVWMKISSGILESAYPMAGEQELKILQEPFRYIGVLARDAWGQLTGLVSNLSLGYVGNIYSGAPLYNSRLSLYKVVVWGFVILGILALFNEKKANELSRRSKYLVWAVVLSITVLICTAIYVQWTPKVCGMLNCDKIQGIQGRYFIPVVVIGTMVIGKPKRWIKQNWIILLVLILHLLTILKIVTTFSG